MTRRLSGLVLIALLGIATAPLMQAADSKGAANKHEAYDDEEIAKAASDFFSTGAKGLSEVLAKVLKEKGRPIAYIRGEEFGGAVVVGLRITVSYMHFSHTKRLNPL